MNDSNLSISAHSISTRRWVAISVCFAIATAVVSQHYRFRSQPSAQETVTAEDEVYAAVVRDMIGPFQERTSLGELVFKDSVLTELRPDEDPKSCQQRLLGLPLLRHDPPPFNTWADKTYRLVTGGWYDDSFSEKVALSYAERSCMKGRLSQTFHTDLPKTFISAGSVHFNDLIVNDGSKSFEQLFPKAGGVIAFSHVGFDPSLRAAVVSTSFVCGGLCGSGSRYFLKKVRGRWQVVGEQEIWVA